MNTDLPNQQPPIMQDAASSPEGQTPTAPPLQDAVVTQSFTPSPKNKFMNIIIIVLVLVITLLTGFFAYTKISGNKNTNSPTVSNNQLPSPTAIVSPTTAVVTTVEPTLSASDEMESLQNDVNGTDLTFMDQDAQQIDQNLQGL